MGIPIQPEELQKAAELYIRGVELSQSLEKEYTAKDMIEFGLVCASTISKEDVEELKTSAIIMAFVGYVEAREILSGHS